MLNTEFITKLEQIAGKEYVSTAQADLICYSYDATQKQFLPDVVVHPGTPDEISRIMRLANETRVPVFPRGAGSGFTGGSLPTAGGIVLVTTRLDRILEID
jgi:glycolate oxidase